MDGLYTEDYPLVMFESQATVEGEPRGFVFDAISHFVNCVLRGDKPLVSAYDGLMITKALTAMVESAEKGQPVDL